jgi:hypothetical protein
MVTERRFYGTATPCDALLDFAEAEPSLRIGPQEVASRPLVRLIEVPATR